MSSDKEDKEWMPASIPPDTSRKVMMRFGDDQADSHGFWWRAEKNWYREGKTAKKHAVTPTHWKEL